MATITALERMAPQRSRMSYEEYLDFAGDAQIVDWVDGEVIVYMLPTDEHQDLSRFLSTLLDSFIQFFELGVLRYAPFEVKLWPDGPSREPDIFFIAKDNLAQLTADRFEGGPDLIVEIISPSSVSEDRVREFTQYEQAAVKEYWLIDPRPRQQQVDCYVLGHDNLYYPAPLGRDGRYQSTILPDFWFDVDWLWQKPLPNPQLALAEIMISIGRLPAEVKAAYQTLYEKLSAKRS